MLDATPPPLGDATRRWTQLSDADRDRHVARLLGHGCRGPDPRHVDRPSLDGGLCYQWLLLAAAAGDPIALGWLVTSHRPLLVARARPLLESDPTEWGAVCLEVLHTVITRADVSEPRWLRRRVVRRVTRALAANVARHLERRKHERLIPASRLPTIPADSVPDPVVDPHLLDLSVELDRVLARFDAATRDGLVALAEHEPLTRVAERHGLSHAAIRQRVTRARRQLAPELAGYRRVAA